MRIRRFLIAVAVLAIAVPGFANAKSPTDRATGGGQVLLGSTGAGNTIAFTARGTASDATGQVQVVDRTAGRGQDQVKFHGIVECLFVNGNYAELAGTQRDSNTPFTLRVWDNGEGQGATDAIFFDKVADDPRCGEEDDDDDAQWDLARGNAQVHDASQF